MAQRGSRLAFSGVDDVIRKAMADWGVPGLAIGVVRQGEPLMARGYGSREVAGRTPVTSGTLFAIGSVTKTFTATSLAQLVDAHALAWDAPVRDYLPEFCLFDPVATQQATIRDLLSHRVGLPSHDAIWYGEGPALSDIMECLRHVQPEAPFRSSWRYQNMTFAVAGLVASRIAGVRWEKTIGHQILEPLAMNRTGFVTEECLPTGDLASPHIAPKGKPSAVALRTMRDGVGPVGSMVSCVDDMLAFVAMHLNQGMHDGKLVVTPESIREMQSPQIVIRARDLPPEFGVLSYGLGFYVSSYRGQWLVEHNGTFDGYAAFLSLLPSQSIGAVVLTNLSGINPVPRIATLTVFDQLLDLPRVPWRARYREQIDKLSSARSSQRPPREASLRSLRRSSHPPKSFVGDYQHPAYGFVAINLGDARSAVGPRQLIWTYNGRSAPLRRVHHNVFELVEEPQNPLFGLRLIFAYDEDGKIDRLGAILEPAGGRAWFDKQGVKSHSGREASGSKARVHVHKKDPREALTH